MLPKESEDISGRHRSESSRMLIDLELGVFFPRHAVSNRHFRNFGTGMSEFLATAQKRKHQSTYRDSLQGSCRFPQVSVLSCNYYTALVLFDRVPSARRLSVGEDIYLQPTQDVLDGVLLLVQPTSGLIPVTFTLVGIARYGRQP